MLRVSDLLHSQSLRCGIFFNLYLIVSLTGLSFYVNVPLYPIFGTLLASLWGFICSCFSVAPLYRGRGDWRGLLYTFLFIWMVSLLSWVLVHLSIFFDFPIEFTLGRAIGAFAINFITGYPLVVILRINKLLMVPK